jgi:hypothetical protein
MKEHGFPYNSLYAYLDDVLGKIEQPSVQQIKQAKREYWKLYFRHYRKARRKGRREFTLGFDWDTLARIDHQRGELSVSKFLYSAMEHSLTNGIAVQPIDRELLVNIHHLLALTVSLLEELLDREQCAVTEEVLEKIERLEQLFTERYNNQI